MLNIPQKIQEAANRISSHIRCTSLDHSFVLSEMLGSHVYLKCEHQQYTGSFKVRGAFNKILSLTDKERSQGIVAASSGNHGAATAFAMKKLGLNGKIFVPENASQAKIDNILQYHVELELVGHDCLVAEEHARAFALKNKMVYVSPYNDIDVVAGQGTIGVELISQLNHIDAILVPIGGGGLISGIASFIKSVSPDTQIIGCLPENSPVMAACLAQGKIVDMEIHDTLSDATAGNIEPDAITFELCQKLVDDCILVSEAEIKNAIITFLKTQHQLIEGAPAVALAALIKEQKRFIGKNVVIIVSGGNISLDTLKKVMDLNFFST